MDKPANLLTISELQQELAKTLGRVRQRHTADVGTLDALRLAGGTESPTAELMVRQSARILAVTESLAYYMEIVKEHVTEPATPQPPKRVDRLADADRSGASAA